MYAFQDYIYVGIALSFLGQILILVFSILYYHKTKSKGGLLMTIGSILVLFGFLLQPILTSVYNSEIQSDELLKIHGIGQIVQGLFFLVFVVGFIISVISTKKVTKKDSVN